MKHIELVNHIEGSILKQQFLEAFLVQSAYIESLLKTYADFCYWLTFKDDNGDIKAHSKLAPEFNKVLRKRLEKMSFHELIELLKQSGAIDADLSKKLSEYKNKRNQVIHHLTEEIRKPEFETELREICEDGKKITDTSEFKAMSELISDRK